MNVINTKTGFNVDTEWHIEKFYEINSPQAVQVQ